MSPKSSQISFRALLIACFYSSVCGISGCGSSSTTSTDKPTTSANSASEAIAKVEAVAQRPAKPQGSSTNDTEPHNGITPPKEVDVVKPQSSDGASSTPSLASKPPAATPAIVPTVVAPTEAQIARWTRPKFEQLKLLARQPLEELAFVAEAESTSNGQWLALAGDKLTLWKLLAEQPVATLWDLKASGQPESVKSMAIDPSSTWIAAGDTTGTLRIWNIADQKEIATKKIYRNDVVQIAISDDGHEIATSTFGKEICVWDAASLEQKKKFEVKAGGVAKLLYAGVGKLAVAAQSLTIWDTKTGELEQTLLEDGYTASLARTADRSLLAFADENRLRFLKSADLSEAGELKGEFARNEILKFTTDGIFLWSANGSSIRCWDRATGNVVQQIDVTKPEVAGLDWLDKSNLLRVVTEDGAIRLWGTVAAGELAGLKPLHAPITITESSDVPATAFELELIIDLRALPQPPNSDSNSVGESTMVSFATTNPIDDTKAFYSYIFDLNGWKLLPENKHTPNYLNFEKHGYRVFISISAETSGRNSIYLTNLGNVDVRKLPKLDISGVEVTYESEDTVHYNVAADLVSIETGLLKALSTAGWLPYVRLNASRNDEAQSRSLEFIRNGITLMVSIQPNNSDPSKYSVQYSTFVARGHLPVPQDCDFIECDASRSPALVVRTSLELDDCQAFYDQAMSNLGWSAIGVTKSKVDDLRWLTYFHNHDELRIRISLAEEGGTWIVVGEYAEQNSWQLAKKQESPKDDNAPAKPGIEAADMPIYKQQEAKVKYEMRQQNIEIKVPKSSHIEIVDFYATKLGELGWKEQPNGFRAEDYAFVTYTKDEVSVQVRVNSKPTETTIGISDDGLLWTKSPPEDLSVISYESWLRKNDHPATVKLLDQYIQAMRSLSAK